MPSSPSLTPAAHKLYSTYLGGSDYDTGYGIAVDGIGNAYVAGATKSADFPTVNAKYPNLGTVVDYVYSDAFVTKLNASGSQVLYSTYLGGSNDDYGWGIAVDGAGNAYVTGHTGSSDFPAVNAKYPNLGTVVDYVYSDAFVTKLNASGSQVLYSTYLGGSGFELGFRIAVDGTGNAYVTGYTGSSDFPAVNAKYPNLWGAYDAFVTKFNASGAQVLYSTYLGGSGIEYGWGIAVDGIGNAYVTGTTYSADFPTVNAKYPDLWGSDAFVTKISDTAPPPPPPQPVISITQSPLSGSPGKLFVQWGDGFSPNTTATLHFTKPDGTEYPTQQQPIDGKGHFGINYKIPDTRPAGTYRWWAVDGKTGKKSPVITYQITPLINVAKIYGKLHINSASGAALSGAKVSTGIVAATTAADGSFSLAKIPAGDQVINFSKSGYQPFSTTIRVPASGAYNMGNRWLVRNGLVSPTIAQAPMSGLPGTTFTQWGTGFTPNGMATLHFKKPDNSEYPPSTVSLDNLGHLETSYHTPMEKPAGVYSWWAIDNATHKTSNTVAYTVTKEVNACEAPTEYDVLLKTAATCRDKWNLTIFYKERYKGYFTKNQNLIQRYINNTLNINNMADIALDLFLSIQSIREIPSLKNKDIQSLVGIGTNQSLQFDAKIINNQYADIWLGIIGAAAESFATQDPSPLIKQGITTSFSALKNLLATIGITTLTKRYQELEIAKQFLLNYYEHGSRIDLLAADYGLPTTAGMFSIIKRIGDQIGTNNYDVHNVSGYIITDMNIVSLKQTEYSK